MIWVSHSSCKATPQKDRTAINPAVQPSERFQQGSKTVPFFRGVHGYVSPVVTSGPRSIETGLRFAGTNIYCYLEVRFYSSITSIFLGGNSTSSSYH